MNGCSERDKEVQVKKMIATTNTGANFKDLVDMYFNTLGYTGSVSQGISFDTDFQPAIDWARQSGDKKIGKRLLDTLGYEVLALQDWLKNKSIITDKLYSLYIFLTSLHVITNALANDEPRRSVLMEDAGELLSRVQTAGRLGLSGRLGVFNACKHIMEQGTDCDIFSIKVLIAIPGMLQTCERAKVSIENCPLYTHDLGDPFVTGTSNAYMRAVRPYYHNYEQAIDTWWRSDANEKRMLDLLLAGSLLPTFDPKKFADLPETNEPK